MFRLSKHRPPLAELDAKRICIIKPSALGDIVQALPVLSALRDRFPRAHIAWVVNRAYAELLVGHPDLDQTIGFDRLRGVPWSATHRTVMGELQTALRQGQFDLVCDAQGLLRSGLMTWATSAARRVGLSDSREAASLFYTDVVDVPAGTTCAIDRYWLLVTALGAGSSAKQFRISISDRDAAWADERLAATRLRIVLNPGARWPTKRWPVGHFSEIARRLVRAFDATLIIVGGAEDRLIADQVAAAVPGRAIQLAGQTTLKQLAAVLSRAGLVITNDSGPMHLAAALGTPVAAVFTCTEPHRAGPYGAGHLVFQTNVWCAGSYLKRCARMECMNELTPDRIWPSLQARVASLQSQSAA